MFFKNRFTFLMVLFLLILHSCAKKGRPSGGPKDLDAPIFVIANPPYETINFDKNKIEIEFNEYITLKDLNKQLVVSPPLKNNPIIRPQGTPSKYITIQLMDTLLENTTYIFDFGKSVQDNNEGNQIEKFQYVFSTGDYIDSLKVKGRVKDGFKEETAKNIKLLLFRADSTYNDSLPYKQKPNYVSSSLDTTTFEFSNLTSGKFYLLALEDKNSDYLFNPKQDKIAFLDKIISLPKDSIINESLRLFQEKLSYKFVRAKEESKGKILIAFKGEAKKIEVEPLSETSKDFISVSKFETDKDTLNYWIHNYKKDSIILLVKKDEIVDTAVVKFRKKEVDTLSFTKLTRNYLEFNDTLLFTSNNPIVSIDTSKIKITDKDTVNVVYTPVRNKQKNEVAFVFDKKLGFIYNIELYPDAVKDIFGFTNDTIKVRVSTRRLEDYGDITFNVQNPKNKNLIVQIITDRGLLVTQKNISKTENITFKYLKPQKLKIRFIHDSNNNGVWDTGNFLQKIQPENVFYYPKVFEIRPNWSLNESITIKDDF